MMNLNRELLLVLVLCLIVSQGQDLIQQKSSFSGNDITSNVFGKSGKESYPVAYADFNSDKITDIIAVSKDYSTIYIFYGQESYLQTPIFSKVFQCEIKEDWARLGYPQETNSHIEIVGVVPADFNGDAILDLMVSFKRIGENEDYTSSKHKRTHHVEVVIYRGNLTGLECSTTSAIADSSLVITGLIQEPLAFDVNGDMIMDLLGETLNDHMEDTLGNENVVKTFKKVWLFEKNLDAGPIIKPPENPIPFEVLQDTNTLNTVAGSKPDVPYAKPHLNAFADVDGDLVPELVVVTKEHQKGNASSFDYYRKIYRAHLTSSDSTDSSEYPVKFEQVGEPFHVTIPSGANPVSPQFLGQSLFLDLNQEGKLVHLIPFCSKHNCDLDSTHGILMIKQDGNISQVLPIEFSDPSGKWGFWLETHQTNQSSKHHDSSSAFSKYTNTISLKAGDYNLDGYPDLIGVLRHHDSFPMNTRAILFENVPCNDPNICEVIPRTFKLNFNGLENYHNVTMASFFDIHEDGLVDVLVVKRDISDIPVTKLNKAGDEPVQKWKYELRAFANSPDYDAYFMKVMVLSGLECERCPLGGTPYGCIISGPVIKYKTTTQIGTEQKAVASQFYRSSYFSLDIPYTIFGIGQSPNFIETLEISVSSEEENRRIAKWPQLIPNSQIVIVPDPVDYPSGWTAKLFLTPSRAVIYTAMVLIGFCTVIAFIVIGLQLKERKADHKERMEEAHRFHMM